LPLLVCALFSLSGPRESDEGVVQSSPGAVVGVGVSVGVAVGVAVGVVAEVAVAVVPGVGVVPV
jgi:hypothetical protein